MKKIFLMNCSKDGISFNEKELQLSHDIPRYMGGTDKDGRHWLCKKHHLQYERKILMRIYLELFNELLPYSDEEGFYSKYMLEIKNSNIEIKKRCKEIAQDCCDEFFQKGDDDNGSSI